MLSNNHTPETIKSAFPYALYEDVRKNPPDEHLTDSNQNFVTIGQKNLNPLETKNDWNCNNFHYKDIYSENTENPWPLVSLEAIVPVASCIGFTKYKPLIWANPELFPSKL